MRRLTAFILVAFMLTASVLPVCAEDSADETYYKETYKEATVVHSQGATQFPGEILSGVPVEYGVEAGYEVTIPWYIPLYPPEVTLETDPEGNKYDDLRSYTTTSVELKASKVKLPRERTLTIAMTSENYSDNSWNVVNGTQRIKYAISKYADMTSRIVPDVSVLDCEGGDIDGEESETLYFAVTELPRVGGSYLDTITFKVWIVDNT